MQRKHVLIGGLLLTVFLLSCNFLAANDVLQSEDQVPRIRVEQALAAVQSGAAVIVDVRSTEAYDASHVEGAISIPLLDIESNIDALPLEKDQWIITYCT